MALQDPSQSLALLLADTSSKSLNEVVYFESVIPSSTIIQMEKKKDLFVKSVLLRISLAHERV